MLTLIANHKTRSAVALATILFSSLIHAESGASVAGTVKDPQGRPVAGASLTLVSRTGSAGSAATSDSAGSYKFQGLPEGDYLVRAESPGFAPFLAEDIHLTAGGSAT